MTRRRVGMLVVASLCLVLADAGLGGVAVALFVVALCVWAVLGAVER